MNQESVTRTFSEENFFAAYKKIRNQFRKYSPHSIVNTALDYLRKPTSNSVDELQKHPWLVFLLLKWVLLDEQFYSHGKQNISKQEFEALLNKMHGLGSKSIVRMPSEYAHFRLWLRNISYQQFLYQNAFNGSAFARQSLLFDKLPSSHAFRMEFGKITNIPLSDFFELSAMLLSRFVDGKNTSVDISWFTPVKDRYNESVVQSFLNILSLDLEALRNYLIAESNNKKIRSSEYYEETLLVRFPLLKVNNVYHLWHPMLFNRGLEYTVYDTLRTPNPSNFMNVFGRIFEAYVNRSIQYLGLPYLTEKQIQHWLGNTQKVTDFLITEDGANIFVDAKGVEIAYLGKVSHNPEIVLDKVETSALKGIEQGFQVVHCLTTQNASKHPFQASNENYLLIVTFKELYLGNGKTFYEAIAREKIDALIKDGEPFPIPLENIYFITVDDLDQVANFVKKGKVKFVELLRKVVSEDQSADTMKFHFRQHLFEFWADSGNPQYIDEEIEKIFSRVQDLLSKA